MTFQGRDIFFELKPQLLLDCNDEVYLNHYVTITIITQIYDNVEYSQHFSLRNNNYLRMYQTQFFIDTS